MTTELEEYYTKILISLEQGYDQKQLLLFIEELSSNGYSKKAIYNLFLEIHKGIQIHPALYNDEALYDHFCDFMDGFTVWGKRFRILPNEPDM